MFNLAKEPLQIEYMSYDAIVEWVNTNIKDIPIVKSRTKLHTAYYNVATAFDIETSSVMLNGEKSGIMYAWIFGMNGQTILGRCWDSWLVLYHILCKELKLNEDLHLPVYIHNAAFDMQWLLTKHKWYDVFAIGVRKVARAVTIEGVEFRCSYILTNKGLAKLSDDCVYYPTQKMVGDLDYKQVRLPMNEHFAGTPLTKKEIGYIHHDALVVMSYIQQQIEIEGFVYQIPMTKTGYARRYTRKACLSGDDKDEYIKLMKRLRLTSDEYLLAKRCFQGGYTHNCYLYRDRNTYDSGSHDMASAYPGHMFRFDGFPVGRGHKLKDVKTVRSFEWYCKNMFVMCDVRFVNLRSKTNIDHVISYSRCHDIQGKHFVDNGRIVFADSLVTSMTSIDYDIYKLYYDWDEMQIQNAWAYKKGYLPTSFVEAVLELYRDKTTLKGVAGCEMEYALKKETLNSLYGMAVMDIYRPEIIYEDGWTEKLPELEDSINEYNFKYGRFLFYLWGVATTAITRNTLLKTIYHIGLNGDYIYADTDSIKYKNIDRYTKYFDDVNAKIMANNERAAEHFGFDREKWCPKDPKGVEHPIGIFEYEGKYKVFKSLGAKRYLVLTENNDLHLTVSGLNKKVCVPWLIEKYGKYGAFKHFTDDLYVPPDKTGKMTHTYVDYKTEGYATDYLGNTQYVSEDSCIYLEPCEYDMSIDRSFMQLLQDNVYEEYI